MLNSFLGVSFGTTGTPAHSPEAHRARLSVSTAPSSPQAGIVRSILKKFVAQFFSGDSQDIQPQPNSLHNYVAIQPESSDTAESLVNAEQERTRKLRQELLTVRTALKQIDVLQSELAVERETGKQLVKFLEEAEREARKVPVLEELLKQRDGAGRTAGNVPIAQTHEIS